MEIPTFEEAVKGWFDPYHTDEDLEKIAQDPNGLWTDFGRETAKEALKRKRMEKF